MKQPASSSKLDASVAKPNAAAVLSTKAAKALAKAEKDAAVAGSLQEVSMAAKAKVKSAASFATVAARHSRDTDKKLADAKKMHADAEAQKKADKRLWFKRRKHERASVVVAAKSMKSAAQADASLQKATALAAFARKNAQRQPCNNRWLARSSWEKKCGCNQ